MKILTPLKAMRAKCLDCCCDQAKEVELCTCKDNCPLWPYRLGKNPEGEKTRTLSDNQDPKATMAVFFNNELIQTVNVKSEGRAISIVKINRKKKGLPTEGKWSAKDVSNIVDVVSDVVALKKNDSNHIGTCPFCNSEPETFVVSDQKQIFTCFGCGATGDAIDFIKRINREG